MPKLFLYTYRFCYPPIQKIKKEDIILINKIEKKVDLRKIFNLLPQKKKFLFMTYLEIAVSEHSIVEGLSLLILICIQAIIFPSENISIHTTQLNYFLKISILGSGKIRPIPFSNVSFSRSRNSALKCQGSTR